MGDEVAVPLTLDEVLVLAEWCQRHETDGDYAGLVQHPGERQALYNLHVALEPWLAMVKGEYQQTWRQALERLTPEG